MLDNFQNLQDLTQINFLVGNNGSGKTKLLDNIYKQNQSAKYFDPQKIDLPIFDKTKKNQDLPEMAVLILKQIYPEGLENGAGRNFVLKLLIFLSNCSPNEIILIDEPENHLHPRIQKTIPKILQYFPTFQFFIATHSPFIITASGQLMESQKRNNKANFSPSQKVFVITKKNISIGKWGWEAVKISSEMLSLGLETLEIKMPKTPANSPILIICEGQGEDGDAKFYNQIFCCYKLKVLFVSSTGKDSAKSSFEILNRVKKSLYSDFNLLYLRDRDDDFPSLEEIAKYLEKNPQYRILRRRAIECYIFSSENLQKLCENKNWEFQPKWKNIIDTRQKQIQTSVQKGVSGFAYKKLLNKIFKDIYVELKKAGNQVGNYDNWDDYLAQQITKDSKIYKELENCIFG
jgi:hypothetical protein